MIITGIKQKANMIIDSDCFDYTTEKPKPKIGKKRNESPFADEIKALIDKGHTRPEIIRMTGHSSTWVHKVFRDYTGKTKSGYPFGGKSKKILELKKKGLSIEEIILKTGFNRSWVSRVYRGVWRDRKY